MGARQSKRSVDITTTPKKEGLPAEGGVVGDAAAPGDGKLERIEEADTKPTTNGIAPHTEAPEDKEKDKDEASEKEKEPQEEVKAEEQESTGESPAEVAEVTTPTEGTPASPNAVVSPDSKEAKKKDKKKKWSFRSISFSKKDKTKPNREETRKNGDVPMDGNVSVQETLAEGGEEAESATAAASSPTDEKSAMSSPSADEQVAAPVATATATSAEAKEEAAAVSPAAAASPAEEKKEEPTPSAPTPVPTGEDKKEEAVEKVEAAEKKVVEVSPAGGRSVADPVEVPVFRVQPVATPSIIERKTSEDLPSLPPSSPPPTPIDPSPLQQARQAAASATALAEALKLPAEAANEEESSVPADVFPSFREYELQESVEPILASAFPNPLLAAPSSTEPPSPTIFVPAKVECPSTVETEIESRDVAEKEVGTLASSRDNEGREIDPKVESVSESPVATEEVCKRQEGEANRVEETPLVADTPKRSDEALDDTNTQSKVECQPVPKEAEPFVNVSVKEIDTRDDASTVLKSELKSPEFMSLDQSPMDYGNGKGETALPLSTVEHETKVAEVAATDTVINETLQVVECQIKSEINNRGDAMKTNVSPNVGYNEKDETATLPPTEIETNSACPTIKQHLTFENLETKKAESLVDKATERAERWSDNKAEIAEQLCERVVEPEHNYAKDVLETAEEETMIVSVTSPKQAEPIEVSTGNELVVDSEEGPMSVSDDILVEAKLAVVIPEDDSVEELTDTTDSVKVIPETDEEKIENEPESDTALPTEETLISEEMEDMSAPEDAPIVEPCEPLNDAKATDYVEDDLPPPPLSEDATLFNSHTPEPPSAVSATDAESVAVKEDPVVIFSTTIEPVYVEPVTAEPVSAEPVSAELVTVSFPQIEQIEEIESCPLRTTPPSESCLLDSSEAMHCSSSEFPDPPTDFPSLEVGESQSSEPQTSPPSSFSENVPVATDFPVPIPEDTGIPSFDYSQSHIPNSCVFEPSAPAEQTVSPRDPTETFLTPPVSPNSQSHANVASDIAATTKDCPQTLSNDEDDRNNRESQTTTGSVPVSAPTSSYDHSDVELKERLAAECLAETECQEEALSCQLSAAVLSTAAQEHHQSAPETEAPVENNVAHDASTTECNDEPPKVAPPAVPTEAPASPPTAPAITEDVASVTKAIEEIDISDKAVAAAVNESIECNTNEIITDAHHQNNLNEYE